MLDVISRDTVKLTELGILAWAPKLHDDLIKRDNEREHELVICADSSWLGKPGTTIELQFVPTAGRIFIKDYNVFSYTGHDGAGNHVSFYCRLDIPIGITIRGRVKSHRTRGNIKSTVLHYVKVVKPK